jgi:chlorite dismutase
MNKENDDLIDISEKGRAKDGTILSSDTRLFVQFIAFRGNVNEDEVVASLRTFGLDGALYADLNDPNGYGLVVLSQNPEYFVTDLRNLLINAPFSNYVQKDELTMFGRTYSFGYESDLDQTLIHGPRRKILDELLKWVIWYPLRRSKGFEMLSDEEQRAILGEHGKIGFKFGEAGFATDVRLACHGLDKNDNDFVIGVLGKELYPLSAVVQAMRKTKQTALYLDSLGPFFIGKKIWQSEL